MTCVIVDFPRPDRCDPAAWDCVIEAGALAVAQTGKPLALVATLPEAMSEAVAVRAVEAGLIPMMGLDDTLSAVEAAYGIDARGPVAPTVLTPGTPARTTVISEGDAKAALAEVGLPIPASALAPTPEEAVAAAEAMGYPVVLKGMGVAHKTEAGLVALNVQGADEVQRAARAMECDGFLVEEMIADGRAELLVGVVRDPAHGFVLTLGAGGTLTEILKDTVSLLLPVGEDDIQSAVARLRIAPVLDGYRGKPGIDKTALVQAVLAVQSFVTTHAARVDEVEINPLICNEMRAVAADALIRMGEE